MKAFLALLLALAAFGAGWYIRGNRMDAHARSAVARAAILEERMTEERQKAEDADRAAAFNGEKVLAHEKTIRQLRAKLPPMPTIAPAGAPIEVRLLESRMDVSDELIRTMDAKDEAFRAHVASLMQARDHYKAALDAAQRRGDTLLVTASRPTWSAGLGTSIDPRDGRVRPAVVVINHLSRDWSIGGGSINGAGFVVAIRSWGHQ